MSDTYVNSATNTYTEARARYVMGKVYEDLMGLMTAGVITKEYADKTRRELLYLLGKKVLRSFQLQFTDSSGREKGGLHYEVRADSSVAIDDQTGGVDFWGLDGITVNLFIKKDPFSPNLSEVNNQLLAWGWGSGNALTGSATYAKSYSNGGYGVQQSIIGKW